MNLAAARAATETEPTPAQIEANNYAHGHVRVHDLDITIETPKGAYRYGKDRTGKPWKTLMHDDYGYVRGVKARSKDKDHIDVFLGPDLASAMVFIVDQIHPDTGTYDEAKVIFGARNEADARQIYQRNYHAGWKGLGSITGMTVEQFKEWLEKGDTKKRAEGNIKLLFKAGGNAFGPMCPHCSSRATGLMPPDFETGKCHKCGKNFDAKKVMGKDWPAPSLAKALATIEPWIHDLRVLTLRNNDYRRVVFTGKREQLVLMCLQPSQEIGAETHPSTDQFIRVEEGEARVDVGDGVESLAAGHAVVIPAGTRHNVTNVSADRPLRLYTVYAPPEHPAGVVEHTKGGQLAKAEQLAFFAPPMGERKDVQRPGSRGGRYYVTRTGRIEYHEPPSLFDFRPPAPRPEMSIPVSAPVVPAAIEPSPPVETVAVGLAAEPPPDPKRAAKFRALADGMQETIERHLDPAVSHQNITHRRSEMAAGMYAQGEYLQQIQSVLYALADLHENGTVPEVLRNVTSRAQVEELLRKRWHGGQPAIGPETYPRPIVRVSDARDTARLARYLKIPGSKELTEVLSRQHEDLIDFPDPKQWEMLGTIARHVVASKRAGKIPEKITLPDTPGGNGWEWSNYLVWDAQRCVENIAELNRIASLGLTPEQWGEAQLEIRKLRKEIGRTPVQRQIQEKERALIGTKIPGYFPTPKATVEHLLELADIQPGMLVLEPSAGKGNIADVIREKHPEAGIWVNEPNYSLHQILELKGYGYRDKSGQPFGITQANFLDMYREGMPRPLIPRIVMNPPFENGQDVDHVLHAYEILAPGGRLVSIMSPHAEFANDSKSKEFRSWFDAHNGTSENLPPKSFMSSERPTGVNARVVVIDKPGAPEPMAKGGIALRFWRGVLAKATQLGFSFSARKPVQEPGSRGGRYYITEMGKVEYGERPASEGEAFAAEVAQRHAEAIARLRENVTWWSDLELQARLEAHEHRGHEEEAAIVREEIGKRLDRARAKTFVAPKPTAPEATASAPELQPNGPVPPHNLDAALGHLAASGTLTVTTYLRHTEITAKTLAKFRAVGQWLLREEGEGYRLQTGRTSVYLLPGQLQYERGLPPQEAPITAPPSLEDRAREIAAQADLNTPEEPPPVGGPVSGRDWLRARAMVKVAKEVTYLDAVLADRSTPEERASKLGKKWTCRAIGPGTPFPTLFDTRKEAVAMAERNGAQAEENSRDRLADALALVDEYTPELAKAAPLRLVFRR
jgi:mannose-6-phosphate isomerase-like protein (cupin superfamily)